MFIDVTSLRSQLEYLIIISVKFYVSNHCTQPKVGSTSGRNM